MNNAHSAANKITRFLSFAYKNQAMQNVCVRERDLRRRRGSGNGGRMGGERVERKQLRWQREMVWVGLRDSGGER